MPVGNMGRPWQHALTRQRPVAFLEGIREAQPRFALSHQTQEIPVLPLLMRRFVEVSNDNGEGNAL